MIKIDWRRYVTDRIWFGWFYNGAWAPVGFTWIRLKAHNWSIILRKNA